MCVVGTVRPRTRLWGGGGSVLWDEQDVGARPEQMEHRMMMRKKKTATSTSKMSISMRWKRRICGKSRGHGDGYEGFISRVPRRDSSTTTTTCTLHLHHHHDARRTTHHHPPRAVHGLGFGKTRGLLERNRHRAAYRPSEGGGYCTSAVKPCTFFFPPTPSAKQAFDTPAPPSTPPPPPPSGPTSGV